MPIISWRCWEHVWTAKCATGLRPYARFYIPYVTDAFIEAKDNQYYNLKGVAINDQIIGDTAQQDGRFIIISGLMASLPLFGDIFGLWSCIQCMRLAVAKRTSPNTSNILRQKGHFLYPHHQVETGLARHTIL